MSVEDRLVLTRSGDPASVSALLVECRPRLLARIRMMMGERVRKLADDDDVLQQVAARILEDRERMQVRDEGHFLNLATRIARNLMIDQVRRPRVQRFDSFSAMFDAGQHADSQVATPSRSAAAQETFVRVLEALETLPDDQQAIVELRYFEGLAFSEIGERLGRSENAVQLAHARALPKLRKLLPE